MSKFYIGSASASTTSTPAYQRSNYTSDDDDEDDHDDIDDLPYPGELPRQDFLRDSFDPQAYLSTLRDRHQTLEDLRSDLRRRSQLLNQELLDLVNGNYEEFLGLGADLRGGDEKVEGVRVGLLGFQREIGGIQTAVKSRAEEVNQLVRDRKTIRQDIVMGRNLLEVGERVGELELSMGVTTGDMDVEEEDEEEEDDEEEEESEDDDGDETYGTPSAVLKKLHRNTQKYLLIRGMIQRIGPEHPYCIAQQARLDELRKTLSLDLAAALRQAKTSKSDDAILLVTRLYSDLGAEVESVRVLKGG